MPKIAIIDDDPDIVEAITILLESKGFGVISAGNTKDAMELVLNENPDIIVLDVMMEEPDDGFYLANKFRQINIKTPIILLTSVSKTLGYEYGKSDKMAIDDFLEKPVIPAIFLEKINYYLQSGSEKW